MKRNSAQDSAVRCLCFDFDGTFVDSFALVFDHYARMAPKYGCRVPDHEERERLRGLHAKEVLAELDVPYRHIPQMALRLREVVRTGVMELEPVPGIRDAVKALAGAGYRLGIVSSNDKEYLRTYLKRHQIIGIHFTATSNVLLGKGKTLAKVARSEGIAPWELLYVGDELRDRDAAKKAGCRFAAVAWGYTTAKTLEDAGVDLVSRTPAELVDGVRQIVGG